MLIRAERHEDWPAGRGVIVDAFAGEAEADLVERLRRDGDLAAALVADQTGLVCGHVGLSWLRSPARALALAPLAVAPHLQRQGIGSALVRQALAEARRLGADMVFVVGAPAYYRRFGFSQQAAADFSCRYAGPHFMVLQLGDGPLTAAEVVYADAFDRL